MPRPPGVADFANEKLIPAEVDWLCPCCICPVLEVGETLNVRLFQCPECQLQLWQYKDAVLPTA